MSKYLFAGLGMLAMEFVPFTLIALSRLDVNLGRLFLIGGIALFNLVALTLIIIGTIKEQ